MRKIIFALIFTLIVLTSVSAICAADVDANISANDEGDFDCCVIADEKVSSLSADDSSDADSMDENNVVVADSSNGVNERAANLNADDSIADTIDDIELNLISDPLFWYNSWYDQGFYSSFAWELPEVDLPEDPYDVPDEITIISAKIINKGSDEAKVVITIRATDFWNDGIACAIYGVTLFVREDGSYPIYGSEMLFTDNDGYATFTMPATYEFKDAYYVFAATVDDSIRTGTMRSLIS